MRTGFTNPSPMPSGVVSPATASLVMQVELLPAPFVTVLPLLSVGRANRVEAPQPGTGGPIYAPVAGSQSATGSDAKSNWIGLVKKSLVFDGLPIKYCWGNPVKAASGD